MSGRESGRAAALADHPPSLSFGRSAPDARLLTRCQGVLEARNSDCALLADRLRRLGVIVLFRVEHPGLEAAAGPEFPPHNWVGRHDRPSPLHSVVM